MKVEIKKDGRLWYSPLDPGNSIKILDVTKEADCFLFYECELEQDLLLEDILSLFVNCPALYRIFGNWSDEIVREALTQNYKTDPTPITKLVIFWDYHIDSCKDIPYIRGPSQPCFNGRYLDSHYSLSSVSSASIRHLPVVINTRTTLAYEQFSIDVENYFTLGQILQAIIAELSFHGSPNMREEWKQELSKRINSSQTVSWEEVMDRLKNRFSKKK